jgi:hypothetical protein
VVVVVVVVVADVVPGEVGVPLQAATTVVKRIAMNARARMRRVAPRMSSPEYGVRA